VEHVAALANVRGFPIGDLCTGCFRHARRRPSCANSALEAHGHGASPGATASRNEPAPPTPVTGCSWSKTLHHFGADRDGTLRVGWKAKEISALLPRVGSTRGDRGRKPQQIGAGASSDIRGERGEADLPCAVGVTALSPVWGQLSGCRYWATVAHCPGKWR
jgi:hypothetical protein